MSCGTILKFGSAWSSVMFAMKSIAMFVTQSKLELRTQLMIQHSTFRYDLFNCLLTEHLQFFNDLV